jgi:feruloyl-CoA synthase
MQAFMVYGGATLSDDVYERIQEAGGRRRRAMRIPLTDHVWRDRDAGRHDDALDSRARGHGGPAAAGTDAEACACGRKMEVRVKGPMVMKGYLNLPEKNKEVFDEEGFYCLGDAARFSRTQSIPRRGSCSMAA